ncbi:hypothetical protein ANO11243_073890 [Dothideomycetidae sp. 11243]|nr:hypothetical protein ANO11243_073890 [fungal sp. No.11243]
MDDDPPPYEQTQGQALGIYGHRDLKDPFDSLFRVLRVYRLEDSTAQVFDRQIRLLNFNALRTLFWRPFSDHRWLGSEQNLEGIVDKEHRIIDGSHYLRIRRPDMGPGGIFDDCRTCATSCMVRTFECLPCPRRLGSNEVLNLELHVFHNFGTLRDPRESEWVRLAGVVPDAFVENHHEQSQSTAQRFHQDIERSSRRARRPKSVTRGPNVAQARTEQLHAPTPAL